MHTYLLFHLFNCIRRLTKWQTGFIEYLEEICSMDTLRWVFEYKKDGNIKLQDDGVRVSIL